MPQLIEVPGMGQVSFPDGMTDADISTAIQRNLPRSAPPSAVGLMAQQAMDAETAAQNAPSMGGSFFRNVRENIGAGVGGALGGAGGGALVGTSLGPLGTIGGALVGAVAGSMGGQKIQEFADPITQERQSALAIDQQVNPVSSFAGQVAPSLITGKVSPTNIRSAFTPLARAATAAERAAIVGNRVNMGAEAAVSAGFDVGQSLVTGEPMDPTRIALNAGAGALFGTPNRLGRAFNPQPTLSTDSQHGVQGDPATGSPSGDGVVPVETNAAVVTPMVGDGVRMTGPLQAAGATRLAGDLAARAGLDPLTLTPSGDNATVTPNDVRAAGAKLPATTQDSGGTMEIPFTRKPDPTIQELLGRDVEWDGNLGKLVDDEGRPGLQLPDNSILELPFFYGTDRALADLGVKPVGNKAADRSTFTRLFGTTEQESMQSVFSKLDDVTDDLLDIAELGASMKRQKGKASIPVRDTPEFAATSRNVTDEQILIAQDQVNQALETAQNAPGLTPATRSAIIDKLTGDLDNIAALSTARDAWQRQRVPSPVSRPEPPSQRATLAAADAASNRAAAIAELNGLFPRRPTAPPVLPPAPVEPSRQLGQRPFNSTDVANRLRAPVEPSAPVVPVKGIPANSVQARKGLTQAEALDLIDQKVTLSTPENLPLKERIEIAEAVEKTFYAGAVVRKGDRTITLTGDRNSLTNDFIAVTSEGKPFRLSVADLNDGYTYTGDYDPKYATSGLLAPVEPPAPVPVTPATPAARELSARTRANKLKTEIEDLGRQILAQRQKIDQMKKDGKLPRGIATNEKKLAALQDLQNQRKTTLAETKAEIPRFVKTLSAAANNLLRAVEEALPSFPGFNSLKEVGTRIKMPSPQLALILGKEAAGTPLSSREKNFLAFNKKSGEYNGYIKLSDIDEMPGTPAGREAARHFLKSIYDTHDSTTASGPDNAVAGKSAGELWAELRSEVEDIARGKTRDATDALDAIYDRQERQLIEFDKAVEEAPAASKATPDELGLEKGDTLTIDGEPLRVIAATDESVTLRDHDKFGDQKVPVDQPIPAENVESQAKARLAEEAPDAIAADEAATRRQAEEHANEKPPADDFALKPHESDAEIKAEKAAAKQKEELAKRQAAPLKGSAGDLTPDIFGEGDTPLFNERRDTPQQKAPASTDDSAVTAATLRDKYSVAPDILERYQSLVSEFGEATVVKTANRLFRENEYIPIVADLESNRSLMRDYPAADSSSQKQKSLIDNLKAHQDEVKDWIKGEQKSGRLNSMPVDILGAQAYDAALTIVVKALEAGVAIKQAVKTALAHIQQNQQLSKDQKATLKAALIAKSQEHQRYMGERDAKLMLEMPKIAEELVAQGKTPTQQDLIAALAARFPDQAPYIKANGDKIFKDMMFARDKRLSRTTDSQREWGEWTDSAIDGTRRMVDSFTKGAPLTNVKQFATNFHATYMTGIGNKMRHLAEGNITGNKSNAWGKWTEDLVGLAKGKDGVHRVSTDLAMNRDVTTFANHLDRIKTDLNPILNAMPRGERKAFMERVGDHITDASRDGELANQPELKRAVEAYVKIREDLLKHMKDSGVEVGDVGPRSMRRVLDRPTILGNPDEFMKQAANAYKAKWRAETAALNKEAAGLDPIKNKDRLASIQTELKEIAKRDAADSARKYLTNIEADEVGITSDGNDLFSHNNGNPSSMKSREFGPEADQLLGKFYLRDPDAILRREIGDSVRAAGVARTFSGPALDPQGNPRPNGEIDPMAKWKKLRQDLIEEGNADMIPMAATLLKEHFNLGGQDSPTMRTALEIAHTHTQLAFLARSAFSSLGEPALAGIRAGSLRAIGEGYVKTIKGMVSELRGLGPDEARIISNAIGTSSDGFNSILAANRFLDSNAMAGKSGELVAMFHAKTWLTALTNATHAASVDISHGFIRTQLQLRQAGGKYKTTAGKSLNEIGITTADIPAMLKFTDDFAKSTDKVKLLTADTPEAKMYRDALHLVRMSGGSLHVLRGTRPQHANSPVGGMFYALKSFLFAFQDQVLSRHARLVQTAVKGETMVDGAMEKLSAAERRKMIGETVQAVATLAAAQYGIQVLRESLFSDPARMKEENKTPAEKARMRAYSVATRSSFFGGYDIIFNAMTGARHGGDPSTVALGPTGGLAGSIFGQIAGIGGKKDSPNTNTHERKLTRSIFDFTAKPLANAAAATLPGYKIATPLVQAFNHPGTREALVETVAGAPMKGGPMKKKSPGF